jgi:putative aldouronate transport system permease protein
MGGVQLKITRIKTGNIECLRTGKTPWQKIAENGQCYIMLAPVLIHLFIFNYIPIYGIATAFQNYYPGAPFGIFGKGIEWVGFKHFKTFVTSIYFYRVFKNTAILSIQSILFATWVPIIFALLVNEITHLKFKKICQTMSYLPYFISMVIVAGIVLQFVSLDGIINKFIASLGGQSINFMNKKEYFRTIYIITCIWKSFGWGSILYLDQISSVDPNLYEAARMDGGNRFKQAIHVTLPSIMQLICIQVIFAIGSLFSANTELVLLLYNPVIYETADVIGTFTYRTGIYEGNYSYGAAVGLFSSVINFSLLALANKTSKKLIDYGLW